MKMFRLLEADVDVMGGDLPYDNPFVSLYGALIEGRPPSELEVGEACFQRYSMSGMKPTTYKLLRVS